MSHHSLYHAASRPGIASSRALFPSRGFAVRCYDGGGCGCGRGSGVNDRARSPARPVHRGSRHVLVNLLGQAVADVTVHCQWSDMQHC